MSLGCSPTPGSELGIGDGIRLLCVAQGGLQVAIAKSLANGGEADASVDELRRVGMAHLVQGGVDAGGSTVLRRRRDRSGNKLKECHNDFHWD